MGSDYVFVSQWTVTRARESLWDVLDDLLATADPMIWWPAVRVQNYDGTTLTLRAASAFGYSLRFSLTDLTALRPDTLTFAASGDLRGTGIITFCDRGAESCTMEIDWRVSAGPRWMRWSGWVLRPLFVAGHHLVMRQGERHLNTWLRNH